MLSRRLDTKLQIAIFIGLAVLAYVLVNVELSRWSHMVSASGVVLLAVSTLLILRLWLGRRPALTVFAILAAFAFVVQMVAVWTGLPYGRFNYSDHLGFKLFGAVPWTVAFGWLPLMLGAYAAAANLTDRIVGRLSVATLMMVAFGLVLDPGAVHLGFWTYAQNGWFYGVPGSSFAGWIVTGLGGAALLEILVRSIYKPLLPIPVQLLTPAIFISFFGGCVAIFADLHLSVLVAVAVQLFMSVLQARRGYDFDDMLVLVDDQDKPVATAPKLETHDDDTPLHRAFSVFIFDGQGRVLLQQRAMEKKTWPGVWSNSCCGHVMLHEATEKAAARRLSFELGLKGIDLLIALPDFRYRAEKDGIVENEICPVLVGFTDARPDPNPAEVADIRWVAWDDFLTRIDDPRTDISPWAVKEVSLLTQSEVFRKWFARTVPVSGSNVTV